MYTYYLVASLIAFLILGVIWCKTNLLNIAIKVGFFGMVIWVCYLLFRR